MATKAPAKPAPLVIFIEALPLEDPDDVEVELAPVALLLNAPKLFGPDSTVLTAKTMPDVQWLV
jgi:hypothetical protein